MTESTSKVAESYALKRRRYTAALHPEVVSDLFSYVESGVIDVNLASLIADVLGPGDWREQAACRGADVELFFPDGTGAPGRAAARRICNGCPVRQQCFDYAQEAPEIDGVWGGFSTRSRRQHPAGATRSGTAAPSKFLQPKTVCIDCFVDLDNPRKARCDVCRRRSRSEANSRYYRKTVKSHGWRHLDARYQQASA